MTSLFPAIWLRRFVRERPEPNSLAFNEFRIVPGLNELAAVLLALEMPILRQRRRLPFGASLLMVARKPPDHFHRPDQDKAGLWSD